ncbi:hypothetical protein ACFL4T_14810 [candidate division KSB1 bacterium]
MLLILPQPEEDWYLIKRGPDKIGYVHVVTKHEGGVIVMEETTRLKTADADREIYYGVNLDTNFRLNEFVYKVTEAGVVNEHSYGKKEGNVFNVIKQTGGENYSIQIPIPDDYKPMKLTFRETAQNFKPDVTIFVTDFNPQVLKFGKIKYVSRKKELVEILRKKLNAFVIEEHFSEGITLRWINKNGKLLKSYTGEYDYEVVLSDEKSCKRKG